MEEIVKIAAFILKSFIHIWPYLLITIPIAVAVQLSGATKYINKAFGKNILISILLATIVGAFSPFCSCGVIPIIAALLIGGVPLAPVMSFWIASPSMDPEIFFLSIASIGWNLSVWRLAATFIISLSAGYITHFAYKNGFLGKEILLSNLTTSNKNSSKQPTVNCCVKTEDIPLITEPLKKSIDNSCACGNSKENIIEASFRKKLLNETWKASVLVVKFMALAFFINALIKFYVPQEFISNLLGGKGYFSVIIATLIGIPAYTSNLTALPMISGLLSLGMNPGAALAFLIAGPVTTIPAMVAVWGITKRKIFILYISFSLFGAILFGFIYNFIN